MSMHLPDPLANEVIIRRDSKFGYIWSINFHGMVSRGSHFSKEGAFMEIERTMENMKKSIKAYSGKGEKKDGRWLIRMDTGDVQVKDVIVKDMDQFKDMLLNGSI